MTQTLTYKSFTLDTATITPEGIAYLLQYGFSQSLQDCVAGRAKKVRDEYTKAYETALAASERDGTEEPDPIDEDEVEAAVEADLQGAMGKRLDAIRDGSVAIRVHSGNEAKDPTSGIVRELLVAWAKSKGGKLPKADSEEYRALAGKMRELKADYIATELERRRSAVAELDIEL